jgi:hypothetical protein
MEQQSVEQSIIKNKLHLKGLIVVLGLILFKPNAPLHERPFGPFHTLLLLTQKLFVRKTKLETASVQYLFLNCSLFFVAPHRYIVVIDTLSGILLTAVGFGNK